MSFLRHLAAVMAVLMSSFVIAGCGARPHRTMQSPEALFPAPPLRVFVEAILADVPADTATSDPRWAADIVSVAARAATAGDSMLSMPHVLVQDRVVASVGIQGAPEAPAGDALSLSRLGLLAHVLDGRRVELEIRVLLAGSDTPLTRTVIANEGELMSVDLLPAAQGRRRVFAVQPWIIRSDDDLRAVFERKIRERDAYLSEYERTHQRR